MAPEARHLLTEAIPKAELVQTPEPVLSPQENQTERIRHNPHQSEPISTLRRSTRIRAEQAHLQAAITEYELHDKIILNKRVKVLVLFSGTGSVEKIIK
eukprot:2341025-Pyramimonas_sp.AAC.1